MKNMEITISNEILKIFNNYLIDLEESDIEKTVQVLEELLQESEDKQMKFLELLGYILGWITGVIIGSLIFWGLGNFFIWVFNIKYVWTFAHGIILEFCFIILKEIFGRR